VPRVFFCCFHLGLNSHEPVCLHTRKSSLELNPDEVLFMRLTIPAPLPAFCSSPLRRSIPLSRMRRPFLLLSVSFLWLPVVAQTRNDNQTDNRLGIVKDSQRRGRGRSIRELSDYVKEHLNDPEWQDAGSYLLLAELMKQLGDYRAQKYYEKAIAEDGYNPGYEYFYAEYLRNFRGAQHPLFPEAEKHYFEALRKFQRWKAGQPKDEKSSAAVKYLYDLIDRGLITLYQEDGVPLFGRDSKSGETAPSVRKPVAFLSSVNRFAVNTADLDEVHDTRDFTSEALLTSAARGHSPLSRDELRGIVRLKRAAETSDRLRFRHGGWPMVDFFFKRRDIEDAKITNFFLPNQFNEVKLIEYGVAVEKPFDVAPYFDLFLRGAYHKIQRKGVVDFRPEVNEDINQLEGNAALSRFFGPDKATLELKYVFQDINPDTSPRPAIRDRRILATTFNYQILRPLPLIRRPYEQQFATRGLHLFGGLVRDKERFGIVDVRRNDYFVGSSINGILRKFDVTIQPGLITASVSDDPLRRNSQYRTDVNVLLRALDEEERPGIPKRRFLGLHLAFFNVVFPFKIDVAREGPKDFENYKVGAGLNAKLFRRGFSEAPEPNGPRQSFHGTTFLVSARYDYQRFRMLNKSRHLFSINLSMGF
jgi:hypothetical protein